VIFSLLEPMAFVQVGLTTLATMCVSTYLHWGWHTGFCGDWLRTFCCAYPVGAAVGAVGFPSLRRAVRRSLSQTSSRVQEHGDQYSDPSAD
jgi:Protein of unknown function (DUF2798)